jgi:cytoskeletal protein CcmA (bactofilin family)
MFERSKRETGEENGTFPTFETRETTKTSESRPRVREAAVIGPSIQINGDLSGEEDLIIQGKVNGTIQLREKSLTVGTQGKVDANVLAQSIIIEGEVKGDVYGSERVAIRKTGNVSGNIVSPKVSLEEGCHFKGSIDMDKEMLNKTFAKTSTAPSVAKPDISSQKAKAAEIAKQPKSDKPATDSAGVKSGSVN